MRPLVSTFSARFFTGLVVLGADLTIANQYGPAALGAYGMLTHLRIGIQALAIVYAANTFFVARDKSTLPSVASNSLALSALGGGAVALTLCAIVAVFPGWFAPVPAPWAILFLATAPAILASFLVSSAFLGAGWIGAWNAPIVANRVILGLGIGGALLLPALQSVPSVVLTLTAAEIVSLAVLVTILRRRRLWSWRTDGALLKSMARYGFRAWAHAFLGYLVLKGDLILVGSWSGKAEAGQYRVGIQVRDAVMFLPWIASLLLLPRVAETPGDRGGHARALALPSMLIATVGGAAVWVFAPQVLSLFYPQAFAPAVPVARILIPAALLAGYAHLLFQDLLGRGAPWSVVAIPGAAVLVMLAGDLFAVPHAGAVGAAWCSLAGSTVLAIFATLSFLRHARRPRVT